MRGDPARRGAPGPHIFRPRRPGQPLPTLVWLLAALAAGAGGLPARLCRLPTPARPGLYPAKTLGLLLLGYLSWLLASSAAALYARHDPGVLGAAGRRFGGWWPGAQRAALSSSSAAALAAACWSIEAAVLGFFLAFWLIRRGNPDLWHPVMGGEKPMDLAYLNAIIKSTYFPALRSLVRRRLYQLLLLWLGDRGHGDQAHRHRALGGLQPGHAHLFRAGGHGRLLRRVQPDPRPGEDEAGWLPRALRYGLVGALLVAVLGNLGEVKLFLSGLQQLGPERATVSPAPYPALLPLAQAGRRPVGVAAQGAAVALPQRVVVLERQPHHEPRRDQRVPLLYLSVCRPARPPHGYALCRAGAGIGDQLCSAPGAMPVGLHPDAGLARARTRPMRTSR